MRLTELDLGVVTEIVRQAHDIEQIYTLQGHRDPSRIAKNVMTAADFSWVAWSHGKPATVFGAQQVHQGVWNLYLLGTPRFQEIIIPLTRFGRKTMFPILFDQLGAHRLEVFLHEDNEAVHRWVQLLGMKQEFVKERYSPDGKAYLGFVAFKQSTNQTK